MRRKAVALTVLSALLLACAVAMTVNVPSARTAADPAQKYGVINVTVNAATDHEIAGSSAFPNYNTGAVDNYYTLAHSAVDNSPSAEGTSSPADTGPIGQTAAAGNFAQPQYADARWPGNSGKATFGNPGGPYAVADAGPYMATASSSIASDASSGSTGSSKAGKSGKAGKLGKSAKAPKIATPKGFSKRLRNALRLWKAKWLPRLHLKIPGLKIPHLKVPKVRVLQSVGGVSVPAVTVPSVPSAPVPTTSVPTPKIPTPKVPNVGTTPTTTSTTTTTSTNPSPTPSAPGNGGFVSTTKAGLDPASGAFVSNGESSLGTLSIGGQIVIKGIDASVQVTNNGTPTEKVAVNIASASIGGVPVTIDQDGVHINGQNGPLPFQQADDALNGALKAAGVQIFTVAPEVKKSANEVSITASALHMLFTQPVAPPGVPSQNIEHIFGEVFVDSLAVPGGPGPGLKNLGVAGSSGSGTGAAGTGSSSGFGSSPASSAGSGGYSSQPAASSSSGPMQAVQSFFTSLKSKPLWLLLTYFLWQAVVLGTGASLWYWRMGGWAPT